MTIGQRLKQLRKELGLTQSEFAKKIEIDEKQYANYESTRNTPGVNILLKVADFCEVSLDYLATGKDISIGKKLVVNDPELLEMIRKIEHFKKPEREKVKWALDAAISKTQTD